MGLSFDRLYSTLVADEEDHGCRELPEDACREVPGNAARVVAGQSLQGLGDKIIDPKTVLVWLLNGLGAPAAAVGLLVPIRESGSLIPQAAMVPLVRRFGLRKLVWVAGAIGQALAAVGIGIVALTTDGAAAAVLILAALAVFALSRSLTSIASKDVLGKTIPRGNRGAVTGIAASVAGVGTLVLGAVLGALSDASSTTVLALIAAGASLLWLAAAATFVTIKEVPSPGDESDPTATILEALALVRDDRPFRHFLIARALLFVTALSPPFIVSLSASRTEANLAGLGVFVVAGGVAGILGSPVWGRLADRSSRLVMTYAAGGGGLVVAVFLGFWWAGARSIWLGPAAYLVLALLHTGSRMGRKTYVVDLARGDRRTSYVAVANTLTGLILLGTGAISAAAAQIGEEWALLGLAIVGLIGARVAFSMEEIHQ